MSEPSGERPRHAGEGEAIDGEERRFLEGPYAPVTEELTAVDLPVTGALPPELDGRYVRIGPNPWPVPDGPHHWFLGAGMVHGVALEGGRASWYRNRWVRTDAMAAQLGEEPRPGPRPPMYDSANTNVVEHAGRLLAFTESSMPYVLDDELGTTGRTDFGGPLPSGFTAHPKVDPVTGELLGFAYWWDRPFLRYHRIDATGRLVQSVDVETPGPVMAHDFAVTERSVVFFDLPVLFSLDLALDPSVPFPFAWDDDYGARVGVMARDGDGSDVRWFDVEPCYVFHPLNAYEDDDGRVVVDVVRHPEMFRRHDPSDPPARPAPATLDRWTIDRTAGKVLEERLDDTPQEFPRVDPRLVGRRHRYGWAAATEDAFGELASTILKHDLVTGAVGTFDLGPDRIPSEPTFVHGGDRAAEDEGWVVTFAHDRAGGPSELVVLDATAPGAGPVATVALPQRVPLGFHGTWVPTSSPGS